MLLYQIAIEKGGKPYDQILADPAGLSDFAENSGMLVEMAGTEVCADPANMIREALDLIADGKRKTKPDHDPIREILPNTDAFLDFADAMADMMFWAMVFALRAQELVRALSMQLEAPSHEAARRGEVDRADGRKAVRLPVLGALDLEAVQVLIQGVIPLFRDLRTREKEGAVFNRDYVNDNRSETARVLDWLRATKTRAQIGCGWVAGARTGVARWLRVERDGAANGEAVRRIDPPGTRAPDALPGGGSRNPHSTLWHAGERMLRRCAGDWHSDLCFRACADRWRPANLPEAVDKI